MIEMTRTTKWALIGLRTYLLFLFALIIIRFLRIF